MAVVSNLYPPIMDSYLPAIVLQDFKEMTIKFAISNYTSIDDIQEIQIQIRTQDGSKTVFKENSIYRINTNSDDYSIDKITRKGIITIKKDKFDLNLLKEDSFYRIQLRFANKANAFLAETNVFTEWSSIALQKFIYKPEIVITKGILNSSYTNYVDTLDELEGYLYFNNNTTEYLHNYRIRIYDNNNGASIEELKSSLYTPIEDSGVVDAASYSQNKFNYNFSYDFDKGNLYTLILDINTNNNYSETKVVNFIVIETYSSSTIEKYIKDINIINDYEKGCNKIQITFNNAYNGRIIIRRAEGRTNYKRFYDIHFDKIAITAKDKVYEWEDTTIESGMLYKYILQEIDLAGNRSQKINLNKSVTDEEGHILKYEPTMIEFDDMFLSNYNHLLKIKFDPTIDSYQPNVMDSKIETIGSKYPYMKRGSAVNYKTFSIGGIISWEGDIFEDIANNNYNSFMQHITGETFKNSNDIDFTHHLFADIGKLFVYDEVAQEYKTIKGSSYNYHKDYTIERLFREAVLEYLNDGNVKLFRSPTEGNILVRLTDISLTSKRELGRLLYDFSATATEIDECSVENYELYNILKLNKDNNLNSNSLANDFDLDLTATIGQYSYDAASAAQVNVYDDIAKKYYEYSNNIETKLKNITFIKIDMSQVETSSSIVGTIVINDQIIKISKSYPYFELKNFTIEDLVIITENAKGKILIDYKANLYKQEVFSFTNKASVQENNVGQIKTEIDINTSLVDMILTKHNNILNDYKQNVSSINKIAIQTYLNSQPVKSSFLIKDSNRDMSFMDSELFEHITNNNGYLELFDDNSVFQAIEYKGVLRNSYPLNAEDTNQFLYAKGSELFTAGDISHGHAQEGFIYNIASFPTILGVVEEDTLIVGAIEKPSSSISNNTLYVDSSVIDGNALLVTEIGVINNNALTIQTENTINLTDTNSSTVIVEGDTLIIPIESLEFNKYAFINGHFIPIDDKYIYAPIDLIFNYFYTLERSDIV